MSPHSRNSYVALILIFCLLASGCLRGRRVPDLQAIFAVTKTQRGKRPVIIIPGILGSELFAPQTQESPWFRLAPIKGDNLSLPISPNLAENRDTLEVKGIIETAKISRFLPEVAVYQALIGAMNDYGGYQAGDWANPGADGDRDRYYVFAYDWRRDNVENARLLIREIERLKEKIGEPDLKFNVLAHSMGGLIARYAAMYGDRDLPADDSAPQPDWSGATHFNKIFMFGTPNEGSMGALDALNNGYALGGFDIDVLNREVVFTSPAVFELLPHNATAKFYDSNLNLLKIDLYDPATWKKYGWSAYSSSSFRSKFDKPPTANAAARSEFADVSIADLDGYFTAVLNRTRQFHRALDADTSVPAGLSFFAFGSDCDLTLDAALIVENKDTNGWHTLFTSRSLRGKDGRRISKNQVRAALFAPGDGRVTRRSLLAETITEENRRNSIFKRNLPVSATFFCESHDELPNNKIVQDNFLTALFAEISQ